MKAKLTGIQVLDFIAEDTGEHVEGLKLHLVSESTENSKVFHGQRCAKLFTKMDCSHLKVGGNVELVYEQPLGSKFSRLVAIQNV